MQACALSFLICLQLNRKGTAAARDSGAMGVMDAYALMKEAFFQRGPLLQMHLEGVDHPIFQLDVLHEFIMDGTWDSWCGMVVQLHKETKHLRSMMGSVGAQFAPRCHPDQLISPLLRHVEVSIACNTLAVTCPRCIVASAVGC